MDINALTTFISSVGFPIVACFLMYKQNYEVLEKLRDVVEANTISIKELTENIKAQNGDD